MSLFHKIARKDTIFYLFMQINVIFDLFTKKGCIGKIPTHPPFKCAYFLVVDCVVASS